MRGVKTRITRLEHAAKARGIFDPDCICFPEKEQPFVGFYVELDIAAAVKCPLHGERFNRNVFFVYVSKWLREKLWNHLWTNHSPQYRKAWFASFPRELWPAEEILVEGTTCLRLKNGTLVSLTSGGDQ